MRSCMEIQQKLSRNLDGSENMDLLYVKCYYRLTAFATAIGKENGIIRLEKNRNSEFQMILSNVKLLAD